MDPWTAVAALTLWGFITGLDSYSLKTILGLIPLVTGFIVGAIFGNIVLGAVIGGIVQLISLGMIPIGGAVPPDFAIVTALLIAAIQFGYVPPTPEGISLALVLLLPAGVLSMYLDIFARTINVTWIRLAERAITEGRINDIPKIHFSGLFVLGGMRALAFFISSYFLIFFGKEALRFLMERLPLWALNGFGVGGAVLPALGLALLLTYLQPERRRFTLIIPFLIVSLIDIIGYTFAFVLIAGFILTFLKLRKAPRIEIGEAATTAGRMPTSLLKKISIRTGFFLEPSWNYERMQALGYLFSILPALKEIYKDPEELKRAALFHLEFFNTNPFLAPIIVGMDIAYEEQNPGDFEFVRGLKTGLMGAFAGLGDSVIYLVIGGILLILSSTLAIQASENPAFAMAPLFVLIIFDGIFVPFRIFIGTTFGYKRGTSLISGLSSEGIKFIREQFEWLAVFSIGALIPVIISVRIAPLAGILAPIDATIYPITLQTFFGALVGLLFVFFAYWLRLRRLSAISILAILFVVGFVLGAVGLLSVVATEVVLPSS